MFLTDNNSVMNSKNFTVPVPTFDLILTTGLLDNKLNHFMKSPAFLENTHLVWWGSHPSAAGLCWRGQRAGDDRNLHPRNNTFTSHLPFRRESLVPAGSTQSIKPPTGPFNPETRPQPYSSLRNVPVVEGEGRSQSARAALGPPSHGAWQTLGIAGQPRPLWPLPATCSWGFLETALTSQILRS